MRKILYIAFLLMPCFLQAQSQTPHWINLMNSGADIGDVKTAYDEFYSSHPFVKNNETQEFKRLMMLHTRDHQGIGNDSPAKFNQEIYLQRSAQIRNAESSPSSNWQCIGPFDFDKEAASRSYASGAAHVYTLEQSVSDPLTLYCGTANAGVYKSTDKGLNWNSVTPFMMLNQVKAMEIDFTDPNIVYFGGAGKIYKSFNGGTTWNATGNTAFQALSIETNDLIMHPSNNQILWAATKQGFFKSIDGALTWDTLYTDIWQEIEFKPGDPSILYAIKQPGVKTEFWKSTDGGTVFSNVGIGYPDAIAPDEQKRTEISVTPAAPSIIYAFATGVANGGSGLYGIYVSHDEGENWDFQCCGTGPAGIPDSITNKNLCAWSDRGEDDGGQYYYDLSLSVSPFDSLEVHTNAVNHWVSYDGGVTFSCPAKWSHSGKINYIHADIHDSKFNGTDWWWACDGGIFYSSSQFDTVERRMFGIEGTDFWGFGTGAWDGANVMVGGTYHNGTLLKDNDVYLNGWLSTMGGDNILGSVNYAEPRIIFSDYGKHKLSGNRTVALTQMNAGLLPSSSYWIGEAADMEYSPFAYNTVFISNSGGIWKSVDNGSNYSLVHNFGTGKVTSIECSWQSPNVMYAAYYPGWWDNKFIYKSVDGGTTWTDITPPNTLLSGNLWAPYDIAISTEDHNKIWAVRIPQSSTYNNLNGKKVYYSSDGGATWTNLTSTLLDGEYITNIEYQRGTDGVYIGTRRGVYYRNLAMSDWALFNNNLPVSTTSIQLLIDYKNRKIRNASNRSVWECDLYENPNTIAALSAKANDIPCPRDTVYFMDHSAVSDSNVTWNWSFPGGTPSSSNLRNPKVVYGSVGNFSVSLTVTDIYGSDTKTETNFIRIQNLCSPDTIPGMALHTDGITGFASALPLNLNSNTLTLSAWIKPEGTQNDWSGIVFTRSSASTSGLSIKNDNEVRYHWNGNNWQFATGLFAPSDKWSHVAMVVSPTSVTIYVNGVGSTNTVANAADEFDSDLLFGLDPCCGNRHFTGLIDEVSVYDRALSQDEIRELMHLTRVPSDDLSLIAYYQFNEASDFITDRVGVRHATFNSGAERVTSTGPFGGGKSYRTNITAVGTTQFTNTGAQISFGASAILPDGEVVMSRINLEPDQNPDAYVPSRSYWILDNYGTNAVFSEPESMSFDGIGNVSSGNASTPDLFKLFTRERNADSATWSTAIASASSATAGTDGSVAYTSPITFTAEGQLVILNYGLPNSVKSQSLEIIPQTILVYPVPATGNEVLKIKTKLEGKLTLVISDARGREILKKEFVGNTELSTSGFSPGVYFYSVRGLKNMQNGKFILN